LWLLRLYGMHERRQWKASENCQPYKQALDCHDLPLLKSA
jgi:hypothetical protein